MQTKKILALTLILINIIVSISMITQTSDQLCTINNKVNGCAIVENTKYGATFGIENPYFGVIGFLILGGLIIWQLKKPSKKKEKTIFLISGIALIIAIYFLALQIIIIKTFCNACLIVDISSILIFLLCIPKK